MAQKKEHVLNIFGNLICLSPLARSTAAASWKLFLKNNSCFLRMRCALVLVTIFCKSHACTHNFFP